MRNKEAFIRTVMGLCASNTMMMAAWYILLPYGLPLSLNIILSWLMAILGEYPIHVWTNRVSFTKIGRVAQRFANETPNFGAFLVIAILAHETFHWKYLIALLFVGLIVYVFKFSHDGRWRYIGLAVIVCGWAIASITILHVPRLSGKLTHLSPVLQGYLPNALSNNLTILLPGGLPLVLFLGCFLANGLQLFAWYTHPVVERCLNRNPPPWYNSEKRKYFVAWAISAFLCFFEYCVLIPVNWNAYKFISIVALNGYMEITLVSVFVVGSLIAKYNFREKELGITRKDILAFSLLIIVEAFSCIS